MALLRLALHQARVRATPRVIDRQHTRKPKRKRVVLRRRRPLSRCYRGL